MITVAGSIPAAVTNNDSATGRPLALMLLQQVYISDGIEALVRSKLGHAWPPKCHEAQSTRVSSLPNFLLL